MSYLDSCGGSVGPFNRPVALLSITVDGGGCERRNADRDVLRTAGLGAPVPNPLTGACHHGLTSPHVEDTPFEFDPEQASKDHGDLLELGALPGLEPAFRGDHAGDAHIRVPGVHPAGVLFDRLGLAAGGLNERRSIDQPGHTQELAS